MSCTNHAVNSKPRRSASFLSKLRPNQQQPARATWSIDKDWKPRRRDSLQDNIQNFLKKFKYWNHSNNRSELKVETKEQCPPLPSLVRPNNGDRQQHKVAVERSKSFNIKCDKGYATYYQIEYKTKDDVERTAPNPTTMPCQPAENNNYQKWSNFHEIGLPISQMQRRRPLRRSASTLSSSNTWQNHCDISSRSSSRCSYIRLRHIPENFDHHPSGNRELADYAAQFYSRRPAAPVKKMVTAYNHQIVSRQSYAHRNVVTSRFDCEPNYANIHPLSCGRPTNHDSLNSKLCRVTSVSREAMEPPPRPPKLPHLQSRKLPPESAVHIERNVKFKPKAPDPDPSPPYQNSTNQWINDFKLNSKDLSRSQKGSFLPEKLSELSVDPTKYYQSDSGSTSQTPDLLIWSHKTSENESLAKQVELKLIDLNCQKISIEDSVRANDSIGQGILSLVETRATPREISKFKLYIEDLDKITSLLVCLSGRLARIENALSSTDDQDAIANLSSKREKLQSQLFEAKQLEENTTKRSLVVGTFLKKYFNQSEQEEFEAFVEKKAKLIMDTREISDKIELCQEQMRSLTKKSL